MAIHDYVLDNQTGQQFRTDLNNALQAIVSQNSSATAPTTTYAYMLWADTTTNLLKMRNSANTAWIVVADFSATSGNFVDHLLNQGSTSKLPVSFQGDVTTGFYSPGAGLISFLSAATELLRLGGTNGVDFKSTAAVKMPVGNTSQRPGTPTNGMLRYNSDSNSFEGYANSVWKGVGGGGGGGSLLWVEDTDSPTPIIEFNNRVYAFASGLSQKLYALIKVPNSYSAGTQIKMRMNFYSPDSSGTALVQTVATLIRSGTDAISSTANQRSSTNSAVTLGAGTVSIPQAVLFDLTDTSGNINSVAVSAGDYIKVQLTRATDTGASDLKVPVFGAEVSFT